MNFFPDGIFNLNVIYESFLNNGNSTHRINNTIYRKLYCFSKPTK
jgi:hypothetical protein